MTINPSAESNPTAMVWPRILWGQGILAASLGVLAPPIAYVGWSTSQGAGIVATFVALVVCWLPNAVSLVLVGILRDPQQSVHVVLASMLMRMGLPIAFAVILMQSGHWLVAAHVIDMVLVFYLVALAVETVLSLWTVGAFRTHVGKAS